MFSKYAQYYDLFNSDKPYKKEIDFVYDWAERPSSIFDIGCGTANYWQYYPKETTLLGIDKSSSMISKDERIIHGDIAKLGKIRARFYLATALFDVLNYIPRHDWWKNIPLREDGYFIFDTWDKEKVLKDGFKETSKTINGVSREITPLYWDNKNVFLRIDVSDGHNHFCEEHRMFLHSHEDILKFCGDEFEVMEVKPTKTWQTWYKLRRK